MLSDSAFWRNLEARLRELLDIPGSARFAAMLVRGQWSLNDGPLDERDLARLHQLFLPLARAGAIAAGIPNGADALDGWLNLLRADSPHFNVIARKEDGVDIHDEGWIQNLVSASVDYCIVRAARAFESETAAAVDGLPNVNPNGATEPKPDESSGHDARIGYRTEIKAYMKGNSLTTNQEAARHFGIGVDTLKSIMSSKGKPRYSQGTLDSVLQKIGHEKA